MDFNKYINTRIIVCLTYEKEDYKELIKEDQLENWGLVKNIKKGRKFNKIYGPFNVMNFFGYILNKK